MTSVPSVVKNSAVLTTEDTEDAEKNLKTGNREPETARFYFTPIINPLGPGRRTRFTSPNPASRNQPAYSGSL